MSKADEAFEVWVSTRFEAGLTPITDLERTVWAAAWEARGEHDLQAVEAVRNKAGLVTMYGGAVTATCNVIERAIKGDS